MRLPTKLLAPFSLLLLGSAPPGPCGPPAPPLVASRPADRAVEVPRTAWIELEFIRNVPVHALRFSLDCSREAAEHPVTVHALAHDHLVVNPVGELPPGDACTLSWRTRAGRDQIRFSTATAGPPVSVLHDRTDPRLISPYPDDHLLAPDPTTETGQRLDVPVPSGPADLRFVFEALLAEANSLDGFSPIGPMVLEVSDALDPDSLPRTPAESLDPLASIVLLDLTPGSREFGRRVPFRTDVRNDDRTSVGLVSHTLLLFPSVPLEPRGRYGLVVTRRVQADPGRPLDPSDFFQAALAAPEPSEPEAVTRTRALAEDVLPVAALMAEPPIPPDDVAFAARISVRSIRPIQDDVQAMKRQILAAPPPAVTIDAGSPGSVVPDDDPHVAALVRGTWQAPDWRAGPNLLRDADGLPVLTGSRPVCFRLALPAAALEGPVPVVIYQHGNPGESETEVLRNARSFLAQAGYAVIGFTDVLNREVAPGSPTPGPACIEFEDPLRSDEARMTAQVFSVVLGLLANARIGDHWSQTLGEQLAFVRAVQGLSELDLLPLGAPDGIPDLDPEQLLYMGVSEGANNGQAFVAYAPEVRAASLVVGGARLVEVLIHQQAQTFLDALPTLFPNLTPADIWVASALFQADFDRQDKHNHGRFVFRDPARVPLVCDDPVACAEPGWCRTPDRCTRHKPSLLLTEGLQDSLVPNHATDSAAWQMGPLPHLAPVQHAVPFLEVVHDRVAGNLDRETTAAFYQFVPDGVPGVPITPGCKSPPLSSRSSREGHYCAQSAVESRAQRLIFFGTAVDPEREAPTIVDPLPLYPEGTPLFPLPDPLP